MTRTHAHPHIRPTRRRLLGFAGSSAAVALLGAGAAACGPEDVPADDARTGTPEPSASKGAAAGGGKGGGKGKGGDGTPLWTATVPVQDGGVDDELFAIGGMALTLGDPLSAWDGATGAKRWAAAGSVVPGARPLHAGGTVYLASGEYDGNVIGYAADTGKETWRGRIGKDYDESQPIAVDAGQVYVTATVLKDGLRTHSNVIAALDTGSGRVVWKEQRDLGTEENGINAAVQGAHLVYTDFKKNLTVRDTATGHQVWTHKTTKVNYDSFAVHKDLVIVAQGGNLVAYALADGGRRWSLKGDDFGWFKVPAVIEDVLYVADGNRTLWAVDPATGKAHYKNDGLSEKGAGIPVRFAKSGGTLYGATELDEGGGVHAFDAATGALRWTFNDGSKDIKDWRVAAEGTHVYALHGPKLFALA